MGKLDVMWMRCRNLRVLYFPKSQEKTQEFCIRISVESQGYFTNQLSPSLSSEFGEAVEVFSSSRFVTPLATIIYDFIKTTSYHDTTSVRHVKIKSRRSKHKETYTNAVKPIAIVFPQFHEIPENNKFWGKGFTEWTFLKPLSRVVNDILIRKPHADIGYYNLLDYDHRTYMRIMADHFGIYGFCFYHFWFKDHPVMHKPVEMMIRDGEPNKPFFFCWANEQWTRRWDGGMDDVLLAQDYSDDNGNRLHFEYLLKFFNHPNYIRVDGKPLFAFYRIERPDMSIIDSIMELWTNLAVENDLTGIHFVRFLGPFDNSVSLRGIKGLIEFEPAYSWRPVGGGPSIFPNHTFDEKIYLDNNPDLVQAKIKGSTHYWGSRPVERLCRSSQFKLYSTEQTWNAIEQKKFRNYPGLYRGTYFYWNNAPRRNFTNGRYATYPHMMDKVSPVQFQFHLKRLVNIMIKEKPRTTDKFLFITAWNEWNEQSMIEPNDIDGYDALLALQSVLKTPSQSQRTDKTKTIVHISHRGGGTEKYVTDLITLFSEYTHVYKRYVDSPLPNSDCILLHIHSAMVGKEVARWSIIEYAKLYKDGGVSVYITIHDYQWLFPDNPNPSLTFLQTERPHTQNVMNTMRLMAMADQVIFPSHSVQNYFLHTLNNHTATSTRTTTSIANIPDNVVVTPHCDVLISHEYMNIPPVTSDFINIAFVGIFNRIKGSRLFLSLANTLRVYKAPPDSTQHSATFLINYHVFGEVSVDLNCKYDACRDSVVDPADHPNIRFHGAYEDKNFFNMMRDHKIHILLYLSLFPETYCYSLSLGINSGLALVYMNRGAFLDRLTTTTASISPSAPPSSSSSSRYFPVSNESDLSHVVRRSVAFVIARQNSTAGHRCESHRLQPTRWYLSNYPMKHTIIRLLYEQAAATCTQRPVCLFLSTTTVAQFRVEGRNCNTLARAAHRIVCIDFQLFLLSTNSLHIALKPTQSPSNPLQFLSFPLFTRDAHEILNHQS
eukprot:gene6839-13853_t